MRSDPAQLLRRVMDHVPQSIFWKDRNSVYLGCNKNFAKAAGLNHPSEVVGRTDYDLAWRRVEADFCREVDARVMSSGTPEHIVEPQLQADGRQAWLDTNKIPLTDDDGNVIGLLGTYEDITERVLAENALKARESDLQVTLDSIGDGVISTDAAGRIAGVNPVAESLLSPHSDPRGRLLSEVYAPRPRNQDSERDLFGTLASRRAPLRTAVLELKDAKGMSIEISETASPILDDTGEVRGAVVVFRDIGPQRRVEEQLRHSQKMESIGQLAGGIAHDFNNVLAGIVSASDLLALKLEDAKAQELVAVILRSAQRAADLTAKLLTFSRRSNIRSVPVDVHQATRDVAGVLSRSIDPSIRLVVELNAEVNGILGDPAEIETALLNIAINARDAMVDGGTLSLRSRNLLLDERDCENGSFALRPGRYIQVSIEDTGPGMSGEIKARIFEPFFTTKPVGSGTGLGLAAVYGVVNEHGGAVDVNSCEGQGTVFHLLFPVNTTDAVANSVTQEPIRGDGHTVLLIDDEENMRTLGSLLLSELGYHVLTAMDGQQGVEVFLANSASIDAVILDVVMPKKSGVACLRDLRQVDPNVAVLACSGFAREPVLKELTKLGIDCFLRKPYRRAELASSVARLCARERPLKQ